MLRRTTFIALTLVMGGAVLLAVTMSHVSSEDRQDYLQLVERTEGERQQLSPGEQQRTGVSKDLYLIENGKRLHSHFVSDASRVRFTFRHGQAELEELMDQVHGTVQDDIFEEGGIAMQSVRELEAEHACYQFHTGRFSGNDVSFRRYTAPGHELTSLGGDEQELMWGQARDVELCLGKERVDFRASRLRATIYSPKGML
jgi:hypothetical protein